MSEHLSDKEVDQLDRLFHKIKLDLSDSTFPTRTNRLEAVSNMKRVLEIHGYEVTEKKKPDPESFPDARDQHLIRQNLNKAIGNK